jgi:ATP-dependent DNA helicase RecG
MLTDPFAQLRAWMGGKEDEHLEFKEAKNRYDFELLVKYCVALANEGGGHIILGVTDKRPRKVVGSQAFTALERTKAGLLERLRFRVDAYEIPHPDGRVVVFDVPSRPEGMPIAYEGAYWMRAGEDLVPMTPDTLRRIFEETGPDYSAQVCSRASWGDLDPAAIQVFRSLWRRKSGSARLDQLSDEQLLASAELVVGEGITYAALVLFGTHQALGKHLAQAEVVFEYRSREAAGPAQDRQDYREGFFLFHDAIWERINLRNDKQHFQDGLVVLDVPTFNERAVREAILNAVCHRDYRSGASIFVRQFARRLEIISPGGLPPGVTVENILDRQQPRNRRIADAIYRCGLVERAGQAVNLMFEECIKESKPRPDFGGTDDHWVEVTLHGQIQDPQFLRFLEKVGRDRVASFTTEDLLALDLVHREQPIPAGLRPRLGGLVASGVLESVGKGRGARYLLSRQFYNFIGIPGVYTRKRGLDRETHKELLLKHIRDAGAEGSNLADLNQVLPELSRRQIQGLLNELRSERKVHLTGRTSMARWYLGPEPAGT